MKGMRGGHNASLGSRERDSFTEDAELLCRDQRKVPGARAIWVGAHRAGHDCSDSAAVAGRERSTTLQTKENPPESIFAVLDTRLRASVHRLVLMNSRLSLDYHPRMRYRECKQLS